MEEIKKRKKNDYIDNKKLYQDMCIWKEKYYKNPDIKLSEELGKAILIITKETAKHARFSKYTPAWKEEMIAEAVIDCIKYLKNFDEKKYNNVHAYITQFCWNAFFRAINEEQEKQVTKYKYYLTEMFNVSDLDSGKIDTDFYLDILAKVENFEKTKRDKKEKQKEKQLLKLEQESQEILPEEDITLEKFCR